MLELFDIRTLVRALWAPSLVTGAIFTLVGLVSVWAALSRRHWFIRALVVAAVLSTTLAIRGHDAVLVFLLQSLVAMAVIGALKAWRTRSRRADAATDSEHEPASDSTVPSVSEDAGPKCPQFSLLDLMLMVLVVAAICGLVVQTPPHLRMEWPAIVILGLSFGGLTLCLRREFAAVIFRRNRPKWLARRPIRGKLRLAFRLFVAVILPLSIILLLLPGAYFHHRVINPLPRPTVVMPVPNGYEDLVRAGEMLKNVTVPDRETATTEEFRAFVQDNVEVFDIIRLGLSRECRVRLTYNASDFSGYGNLQLFRALIAEGKLAEAEGRLGDAVTSYLDAVRFTEAMSYGGMVTDDMVGGALEREGVRQLVRIIDSVPHRELKRAIDLLQAIDSRRESPEDVLARDRIWIEHNGVGKQWRAGILLLSYSPECADCVRGMSSGMKHRQGQTRLAICKMAIRRYQLDHDRLPGTLADLVPEYLGSVPEDPFGGQPIVYRPDSAGPILYSVGPDRRDDGGKPLDWSSPMPVHPGDVLLIEPEDVAEEPVEAE